MDIEHLDTEYGKLVVAYVKAMLTTETAAADPSALVGLAIAMADETEKALHHRFVQREVEHRVKVEENTAKVLAGREKVEVTWEPDELGDRMGLRWFVEEKQALRQAYLNGETAQQCVLRHRRSPTALAHELAQQGLLEQDNRSYYDVETGAQWL